MPFLKAFKDEYTSGNIKFISKDKIYQVIDFDFIDDGLEFAIIDDLGEEFWLTDNGEFSYKKTFYNIKIFNMNYQNGMITII